MDPRHSKRIKIVQELYSRSFSEKNKLGQATKNIIEQSNKIEKLIASAAPKYEIGRIAKVDLAILKLAVYELAIEKEKPYKVIINEAIELAKELAGETSPAFINAVLGKIYDLEKQSDKTN